MKRFYETVAICEQDGGYAIKLDKRPVKTPAGRILLASNMAMAARIKEEWQSQDEKVDPSTMPITQISTTRTDRVCGRRQAIIDELAAFGETDLICYRAPHPDALVALQSRHWDPILDWARTGLGIKLQCTCDIRPVSQDSSSLKSLCSEIAKQTDDRLTALHMATTNSGSIMLGLAFVKGFIDREALWKAAMVDEDYQISQWGENDEARKRRAGLGRELDDISLWLTLLDE